MDAWIGVFLVLSALVCFGLVGLIEYLDALERRRMTRLDLLKRLMTREHP